VRVLVQEAVLIEKPMEHTGVDLLFFDNLRLLEVLKSRDELLNPLIDLGRLGLENLLEVEIGGFVDFLGALSGHDLTRIQNRVLGDHFFDLVLDVNRNLHENVRGFGWKVRIIL
jgi:hypothetical protein